MSRPDRVWDIRDPLNGIGEVYVCTLYSPEARFLVKCERNVRFKLLCKDLWITTIVC